MAHCLSLTRAAPEAPRFSSSADRRQYLTRLRHLSFSWMPVRPSLQSERLSVQQSSLAGLIRSATHAAAFTKAQVNNCKVRTAVH